jgi:hypothetical protein
MPALQCGVPSRVSGKGQRSYRMRQLSPIIVAMSSAAQTFEESVLIRVVKRVIEVLLDLEL